MYTGKDLGFFGFSAPRFGVTEALARKLHTINPEPKTRALLFTKKSFGFRI